MAKNSAKPAEPKSYEVLSPIKHAQGTAAPVTYVEGDTLQLDADQAAELIAAGALKAQ